MDCEMFRAWGVGESVAEEAVVRATMLFCQDLQ